MRKADVIYDLTSESRLQRPASMLERPKSRTIGVQTDTMQKCSHHKKAKCSKKANMLTVEKIWTGPEPSSSPKIDLAAEYMDPKDAKLSLENAYQLPPKSRPETAMSGVSERKRPKSGGKRHKEASSRLDVLLKPCLNVHQRRVVKYNMLLSIAINFLVFALGATGFVSIINGNTSEKPSFQYGNFKVLAKNH